MCLWCRVGVGVEELVFRRDEYCKGSSGMGLRLEDFGVTVDHGASGACFVA